MPEREKSLYFMVAKVVDLPLAMIYSEIKWNLNVQSGAFSLASA